MKNWKVLFPPSIYIYKYIYIRCTLCEEYVVAKMEDQFFEEKKKEKVLFLFRREWGEKNMDYRGWY